MGRDNKRGLFPLREESTNIPQIRVRDKAWVTNRKSNLFMGSHQAVMRLKHKDWVGSKLCCSPDTEVWGRKGRNKKEPSSSSSSFFVLVSLSPLSWSTMAEGSMKAPWITGRPSDFSTCVGLPCRVKL